MVNGVLTRVGQMVVDRESVKPHIIPAVALRDQLHNVSHCLPLVLTTHLPVTQRAVLLVLAVFPARSSPPPLRSKKKAHVSDSV
jgi:hypothetical protein